ncbi:NADH-cytochrome b5 reductase [Modicella reniformis]|uniref:cytochrome-b5 reductase n=1 Tax=Modicella reniformis TaxID=1440133 RepID=A0A9P6LTD5_9FUNG|nr:NADH-cytochrome b5 reductase [Modicella reniformis]
MSSALNPTDFVDFKLKNIRKLTHNTSRFTFDLKEGQNLGLDITSCVVTKFVGEDGKPVIRPYTPTSDADHTGSFDFVIKRYEGPISKYPLAANQHESVNLIAGGSGITPMIQIVSSLLKNKTDKTKIHLIYANVSPQDIILKDELDAYAKAHPDRFKVTYVVDKPTEGWNGPTGYVTAELIKKSIPDIGKGNSKVFVCGPPPMMKTVSGAKGPNFTQGDVGGALKELGLTNDQVFKY